jgi:hypothetical protein
LRFIFSRDSRIQKNHSLVCVQFFFQKNSFACYVFFLYTYFGQSIHSHTTKKTCDIHFIRASSHDQSPSPIKTHRFSYQKTIIFSSKTPVLMSKTPILMSKMSKMPILISKLPFFLLNFAGWARQSLRTPSGARVPMLFWAHRHLRTSCRRLPRAPVAVAVAVATCTCRFFFFFFFFWILALFIFSFWVLDFFFWFFDFLIFENSHCKKKNCPNLTHFRSVFAHFCSVFAHFCFIFALFWSFTPQYIIYNRYIRQSPRRLASAGPADARAVLRSRPGSFAGHQYGSQVRFGVFLRRKMAFLSCFRAGNGVFEAENGVFEVFWGGKWCFLRCFEPGFVIFLRCFWGFFWFTRFPKSNRFHDSSNSDFFSTDFPWTCLL